MKKNIILILGLILLSGFAGLGVYQLVGGGVVISHDKDATADPSAILDVQSTEQGVLIPRMTTEQRNNIENPATGLVVFNTDKGNMEFYNGQRWEAMGVAIGTIQPFAGDTSEIPQGWLLCDGRELLIDQDSIYFDLYLRIGKNWGGDDNHFRVPDLRGLFLRGADLDANRDPESTSRTYLYTGGNDGGKVGSLQYDAFENHKHYLTGDGGAQRIIAFADENQTSGLSSLTGTSRGDVYIYIGYASSGRTSNETRPKNVYVNYIIKF